MSLKSLFLLAALAVSARVQAEDLEYGLPLSKRSATTTCNADNALRNLRDKRYSSSASVFCSVWLQSTITNTLQVTATASATATETPNLVTVTVPETLTITNTETSYTTQYPTAVNTFAKRGEIPYPTWLTSAYAPSRISSACSCFIESPSAAIVATFTTTVATKTNTDTTTLEPLTETATTFATATASATKVVTVTGDEVPCGAVGCADGEGYLDSKFDAVAASDCKEFCQSDSTCKSFLFGPNVCIIFDVPVADAYANGFSTDPLCTPYKFYDVRCVV